MSVYEKRIAISKESLEKQLRVGSEIMNLLSKEYGMDVASIHTLLFHLLSTYEAAVRDHTGLELGRSRLEYELKNQKERNENATNH